MVFDCVMKEIDNRQPSDGLTKTCKKTMGWNGKCDICHANTICLKIGATKFVLLSSKTVISRVTYVKKLNLLKRFSEPFYDGASLYGVSVINPIIILSHFLVIFNGENMVQ